MKSRFAKSFDYQQRHEDFCQNIVLGMKPADAAAAAGWLPSSIRSGVPGKLLAQPAIQNRLAHLRGLQARRLNYTVDSIVAELEAAQQRAIALARPGDEIRAILAKAKMLGLLRDDKPVEQGLQGVISVALARPTKEIELTVDEFVSRWGGGHMALANALNGNGSGNGQDR